MNSSRSGFVSIIGAGPGDPGLITVKGLDRLQQAEVVLADRLVAPQLLAQASALAEIIDVGKAPTGKSFPQERINALMIHKARQGKHVARLKGGDPFVFGRGGEECQALAEAGISYEVIPGVSSAVAAPAYAGIPVTHRELSSAFTIVTGHTCGPDSRIDWAALARCGTLIFLMGVTHLPEIQAKLLANGMPAETPVAVIERGTTASQCVVTGSLSGVLEKTRAIHSPATIIIGDVVKLRSEIDWFEPVETARSLYDGTANAVSETLSMLYTLAPTTPSISAVFTPAIDTAKG